MAFNPKNFVVCSRFPLFRASSNLWLYVTSDTLEDCLAENYFRPRENLKNQDSPEVNDIIQLVVENSKLAYLKIIAKTEKPYNIVVQQIILENENEILQEIAARAIKETDFNTPITSDNLGATMAEIKEVRDSSLTFKGFVSTTDPRQSSYEVTIGNMWINSATMPTTFPVSANNVLIWNGTSWDNAPSDYTASSFDFFRDINDGEGYYWFAGEWVVMSTDLSTTYFNLNQTSGKWEIKTNVELPGTPTIQTEPAINASTTDKSIVTVGWVNSIGNNILHIGGSESVSGLKTFLTGIYVPTPLVSDNSLAPATTAYINNKFLVVDSLPATPDPDTFYFIKE